MRTMKHWALAVMTAAALALAGCGGGSSPPQASGPTPAEMQHTAVSAAITAAEAAVNDLTAMSTDADVTAAETAIAAARTALNGASLLSANEVNALDNSLDAIDDNLVMAKADIAEHRRMVAEEMTNQRMAADNAIDTAMTAVGGLSNTSTDAEVMAAKDAIQDAKDAVAAATALSMADRDSLTARISMIETTLASTESNIADHRQMVADDNQRMAVSDAIGAAMTAVDGLSATSSDEDVAAAEGLIQAAKDALNGATSVLTAAQALAHSNSIATIEMTLGTTKTAIAAHREQEAEDAETQRVADVSAARMAAMQSYMAADADATKAETAAGEAEMTAPGSQGAMDARADADAAREAANAAKAAHDAIMDSMTKAEADAEAAKAATQASNANSSYMMAKAENDAIQTAKATADEQQRMADIAEAKTAAGAAVMAAETAKNDAATAAMAAEQARDDAHAAYMRAMAARTDATNAKAEYEKAKAAAMAARTAADAAETAYMAAKMAADGIMDDGTADAAESAQMMAETEQGKAETQQMTAETEQGKAEMAEMAAMTAAGTQVLQLFLAANGAHVMDVESTPADERAAHVTSVGAAMAVIAAVANGAQAAGTTATITFPGDTVDDPTTVDDPATLETVENNEFSEGMLGITVNVAGTTAIVAEFGADRAADSTVTPAVTQRIQTARKIADLGTFQGYELWEDDGNADTGDFADRARAILFTNKQKGDDSVLEVTAATARSVENVAVDTTTLTKLGTKSGNTYTGAEYTPTGESALTGTLTCPSGTTCSVDATTAADGTVTINAVTGYLFTGSRAAREAVTAAVATENNNYLAFGLWLEESDDGATDTFGAFAVGGTGYDVGPVDAVTGTAMYSGKAAGAHHKTGEGVNWFDGDASLTANFGGATEAGSISGMINNIRVAGGDPMSAPIYLGQATLTGGTATFNGAAFMGAPTAPGASTHEFDGTWSGSFFGATANDAATTDVDESITAPLAAAGTFGVTKSMGTGDDMVVESYVGAFGAHKQ